MKQGKETGESHLVDVMIDCMKTSDNPDDRIGFTEPQDQFEQ